MNRLCFLSAFLSYYVRGTARFVAYSLTSRQPVTWRQRWRWAFIWGRDNSPEPVRCRACGWAGQLKHAAHSYELGTDQEVHQTDYCPNCEEDI